MYMYFFPSDIVVAKQNQGRQRLQGGFGEWGTNIKWEGICAIESEVPLFFIYNTLYSPWN